jgi:DMSO reductase anchor subunit
MIPMLVMTFVDIFTPPFLGSPGILFAYMMNDAYEKPAITLTILWEAGVAIFGFYIFNVIWGTCMLIRNKSNAANKSG